LRVTQDEYFGFRDKGFVELNGELMLGIQLRDNYYNVMASH